ncbi:MAG: pyridoxamine 5'-phosphate oxidase family protein [Planctomycetes bacterium]|nr:pyridoxamine 5'-phosphate oxidase family protein [Planctomycetota bacterium]MCH9725888.1 pyridoxamine 5'-phosphate oxidase family protein [Planctomycetota bacterium]MCH9777041.1 pyridoxamine 5'-phosphate oxidase family protein [Planctomycetota bacterium]MCH9793552.1 pyridoxamine 5'-phosphate oxidase family protein [Planctomycetota bacterium]MDF1742457.1 pyridoxamine 5'-phosphate oxidase family protein [Gimesia sp.]
MEYEESCFGSNGERRLQEKYGTKKRADRFYERQMIDFLNPHMQEFIREQELLFIATSDSKGECDSSFRAGLPGFVRILNKKSLAYPEYRGNGVLASLGNISENPHIGLMFLDFFKSTIGLHINGKASIVENCDFLESNVTPLEILNDIAADNGKKPERWVKVEVEEAYIHCSKHIPLLSQQDKTISWGTDDMKLKGGNFFHVQKKMESGE